MLVDLDISTIMNGLSLERLNQLYYDVNEAIRIRAQELNNDMEKVDINIHNLIRKNMRADAIIMLRKQYPDMTLIKARDIVDWYGK